MAYFSCKKFNGNFWKESKGLLIGLEMPLPFHHTPVPALRVPADSTVTTHGLWLGFPSLDQELWDLSIPTHHLIPTYHAGSGADPAGDLRSLLFKENSDRIST